LISFERCSPGPRAYCPENSNHGSSHELIFVDQPAKTVVPTDPT
jgi:hypothetical protein